MLTPIERQHRQKLAALEAENTEAERMEGMPEYDRVMLDVDSHRRHLANLQGIDAKVQYKQEILPDFTPYVDGVLSSGQGAHDEVLVTVLIWRIDVGDIAGALEIADYAIPSGMDSPSNFKRDLKNMVTEEIAEYVLVHPDTERAADCLDHLFLIVEDLDLVDEVRATLMKALGTLAEKNNLELAIEYYEEAIRLNPKCGLKGRLKKLKKQLNTPNTETIEDDEVAEEVQPEPTPEDTTKDTTKDTQPTEAIEDDQTD